MLEWCDAHNHLHDARLNPWRTELLETLPAQGIVRATVNGTRPEDWLAVVRLCRDAPWLTPSCGLHPWYVNETAPGWLAELQALLEQHPEMHVGEIGLDHSIAGHDAAWQREAFTQQWKMAAALRRVVTVHCVRAFEPLRQVLIKLPDLPCGFLLHAWSGPAAMVSQLVEQGAWFSFSPYFLHHRKAREREMFARIIPAHRLLLETDAPDMLPPPEAGPWCLAERIHDPRSLPSAGAALSSLRGWSPEETAAITSRNWHQLFQQEVSGD